MSFVIVPCAFMWLFAGKGGISVFIHFLARKGLQKW